MSNLENITQKIMEDAKKTVAEIDMETGAKTEQIIKTRVDEAIKVKEKILERAKLNAASAKDKIISTAQLKARDEQLTAKQRVMDRVFEKSKEKLKNLSDEDYLGFVEKRLKELNLKDSKEIIAQKGREKLLESKGYKVSTGESVDSGFAILDGKTVINYDFSDLVDFNRLDLEGEIAKILFDGKE
ncbi:MAG: V-type ATP synthase subunit E [Tissierellia bacterium]|nr:V-type ATP synthase subunit E [Tissierellia bacterium]